MKCRDLQFMALLLLSGALAACAQHQEQGQSVAPPADRLIAVTASIQELMDSMVDPAADVLWESVSYTQTASGEVQKRPQTAEEWHELRRNTITLIEATNLLAMEGRNFVAPNSPLPYKAGHGALMRDEGQKQLDTNHAAFLAFANSLHVVGITMLKAVDERDVDAVFEIGGTLDEACEACHTTFWYPN